MPHSVPTDINPNIQRIEIACAADENYAKTLAVMLYSAGAELANGYQIRAHILGERITPESKIKIEQTIAEQPIQIEWITGDFSLLDDLKISHHVSHVAYHRLLIAEVLSDLDKVLYIDSDMIVRSSLHQLWEMDFDSHLACCVPDIACPYVNARHHKSFKAALPYLCSHFPIPNFAQLKIPAEAMYFNSGLMLIDLKSWRQEMLAKQFLECLRINEKFVWCWDQYALNVVLAEKWKPLRLTWNQGSHTFEFPSERESPVDQAEYIDLRDNPDIVHFTTEWKPWDFKNNHPSRPLFFETLDKTGWNGWRPDRPPFSLKRYTDHTGAKLVKSLGISYRKIANLFS